MVFEDPSECRIARLILCVGLGRVAIVYLKRQESFSLEPQKGHFCGRGSGDE